MLAEMDSYVNANIHDSQAITGCNAINPDGPGPGNLGHNQMNGMMIDNGSLISKHLSSTTTWKPLNLLANGDVTTSDIIVTGATVGDTVAVGFHCGSNNVLLSGQAL
jgi:hypothetical protein